MEVHPRFAHSKGMLLGARSDEGMTVRDAMIGVVEEKVAVGRVGGRGNARSFGAEL